MPTPPKTGQSRQPTRPKGSPKTPGSGRAKGTPNRVTAEAREAASAIVDDPLYRAQLLRKAQRGRLNPAVEVMLWHYSKGKPVERVEVSGKLSLASIVAGLRAKPRLDDMEQRVAALDDPVGR